MLLIGLGFAFLFSRDKWVAGVILMFIGSFFILPRLQFVGFYNIGYFVGQNLWAIGLVTLGIVVLCKAIFTHSFWHCRTDVKCHSHGWQHQKEEAGYIDRNCVFTGGKEKLDIQNFKGGEVNSVFGGIELDLSDATLAEGVHHLELNSVFGGIVLFVPVDWRIEMKTTQVFGAFADNRPKPSFEVDEKRVLIIEANAVFGGGEIKCK
jgi:predicted membrane protein